MGVIGRAPPVKAILHPPTRPDQSGSKSFLKFCSKPVAPALFDFCGALLPPRLLVSNKD